MLSNDWFSCVSFGLFTRIIFIIKTQSICVCISLYIKSFTSVFLWKFITENKKTNEMSNISPHAGIGIAKIPISWKNFFFLLSTWSNGISRLVLNFNLYEHVDTSSVIFILICFYYETKLKIFNVNVMNLITKIQKIPIPTKSIIVTIDL